MQFTDYIYSIKLCSFKNGMFFSYEPLPICSVLVSTPFPFSPHSDSQTQPLSFLEAAKQVLLQDFLLFQISAKKKRKGITSRYHSLISLILLRRCHLPRGAASDTF